MTDNRPRCAWCLAGNHALYREYHDTEWGVPCHDDQRLFEFLILEGAQAGLSWLTILKKRMAYRAAFADFDPQQVARFTATDQARLQTDPGIVRNRAKIAAAIDNAARFIEIQHEFGSFDHYLWRFVDGQVRQNRWRNPAELPTHTAESTALSRDLTQRGLRFVGPIICYALMQAIGLVNDHFIDCYRHQELGGQR
jgi:DNA-3-methyladenine glycosylase I